MDLKPPVRAYQLRKRLLILVGVLVGLVVMSAAGTVFTAVASRRAIGRAHAMELASRRAALLSVIVREQYIHEAHTIILRDRSHVAHHDEWVHKLGAELDEIGSETSAGRSDIEAIRAASAALSRVFAGEILPAVDAQDWGEVRRAHETANELVDRMTAHADALASSFDRGATEAEEGAEKLIGAALGASVALGAVAALLAFFAGQRLWEAFSVPLASLEGVVGRVASGDRHARVDALPAVELEVVGSAFNRMLDALARAEAAVVASERLAAVGRVAAGVAHEINNPVAVIRGYVKTMRAENESPALREELAIIDEEAAACQRIAEDLLVYAHSPTVMVPVPAAADQLLREAVDRCDSPPSARGEPTASWPPVVVEAEPALIAVDPLRIRQIVVNLVNNAREASAGAASPVLVRGERRGDGYRIEVLDRGRGVSGGDVDRIFEPFFTTRRDGTGLGLAVCYGLVSAHGGTIRAEPRAGGGSRLIVDLPGVLVEQDEEGNQERG